MVALRHSKLFVNQERLREMISGVMGLWWSLTASIEHVALAYYCLYSIFFSSLNSFNSSRGNYYFYYASGGFVQHTRRYESSIFSVFNCRTNIWGGSRGGSGGSVEPPKLNVKTYNKLVVKKKWTNSANKYIFWKWYFFVSWYAKTAIKTRQIYA